jgi:hypothetical protein
VAEGGHQPEPEGQYEKSVRIRMPLRRVPQASPPRAWRFHQPCASGAFSSARDIAPPERALSLPISSSAASACEQAFSRELLLRLSRETVLAAVPRLRSSARRTLALTVEQAMSRARPIRSNRTSPPPAARSTDARRRFGGRCPDHLFTDRVPRAAPTQRWKLS